MPTQDPAYLREVRKLPCIACGTIISVEAHHILPKGMGNAKGGDDFWNVMPLCTDDHTQAEWAWHRNLKKFFGRYPHVWAFLQKLGWYPIKTGYKTKLIHPAYRDLKPKQKPHYEINYDSKINEGGSSE
ncbi:HNH endonuclease signature motif containing protein [Bdellovibrio bacteriovorus]